MGANEKLENNAVTQRLSSYIVGDRGKEFASDLEEFMGKMTSKYNIEKGRASKLMMEYLYTYIDEWIEEKK